MLKNFMIFKRKNNGNDKAPTHAISTKIGEEFIELGSCWTREANNGSKFLSCKLSDAWVSTEDNKKTRRGYGIIEDKPEPIIDPSDGRDLTPDDSSPF